MLGRIIRRRVLSVQACPVAVAVLFLQLTAMPSVSAQEAASVSKAAGEPATIEDLQRRIEELEAQQADLRSRLLNEGNDAVGASAPAAPQADKSKVGIEPYGYIKLDAAWDSSHIDDGDFARWVEPDVGGHGDSQFSMTAQQTRLGLKFRGPELSGAVTGALVEMDFYGGGTEIKANPMMRKAYMTIAWPDLDLKLLAGQDSDVISPLYPETVNYTVQWWAGNIGYRRPQVRITKGLDLSDSLGLEWAVAASRTVGRLSQFTFEDSGQDAAIPTMQSRLALSFPLLTSKRTVLGASGHWGREEYEIGGIVHSREFDTWSINYDVTLPVTDWLQLKHEGFFGQDLDAYLGGIGQGVNVVVSDIAASTEIRSWGGWVAASIGPFDSLRFNVGASLDNPQDSQLSPGSRQRNFSVYGNAFYRFYQNLEVALEVGWWRTDYELADDGDAVRVQTALIFHF